MDDKEEVSDEAKIAAHKYVAFLKACREGNVSDQRLLRDELATVGVHVIAVDEVDPSLN